jgi:hypothetical protein
MTMWFGIAWSVTLGSVVVLLGALAWMLIHRQRPQTIDNGAEFSLERYRPMKRLLGDEDIVFLESQPGYRPAMGAQLKRERRRIFRLYLGDLKHDFHRLHAQARALAAGSGEASSDLVQLLLRQQLTFLRATTLLEMRLALSAVGIGAVDVRPLLAMVDGMRQDLALRTAPQFG